MAAKTKNKKILTVVGIAGAAAAAWYFLFRTKAGATVVDSAKRGIEKIFDLAPSYGSPGWDAYSKIASPSSALGTTIRRVIDMDFGSGISGGDRAEVTAIVQTRLLRNYKDLSMANENTISSLVRQDPAYQKMLMTYKATGAPWAGGSADRG